MTIKEVTTNKRVYMTLLLLADEQENMVEKYLDRGTMFVLEDNGVKAECVVTDEGGGVLEIKNLAVLPEQQGNGYGTALIQYVEEHFKGKYHILQVGTGDSPLTIPFYQKCGFIKSHCIQNFFTDNYDHPIFECGVRLVDMIYLRKSMTQPSQLSSCLFQRREQKSKSPFSFPASAHHFPPPSYDKIETAPGQ